MKPSLTALAATALLLLTLTACGNQSTAQADFRSVADTQRGVLLSLGMSQEELETKLGTALEEDTTQSGYFAYPSTEEASPGASLLLQEGVLQGIVIQNPALKLQGDFGVGSQISQLGDSWTLTQISDTVDSASRFFDQDGNLLLEATGAAVIMQTLTFYDGNEAAAEAGLYALN